MLLALFFSLVMMPPSPRLSIPVEMLALDAKELWMDALEACESQGNPNAAIIDTNGYWSRGAFQFQLATWLKYGAVHGTTRENIFDRDLQRIVVREMLDHGGSGHWYNCNNKVSAIRGPYPVDSVGIVSE